MGRQASRPRWINGTVMGPGRHGCRYTLSVVNSPQKRLQYPHNTHKIT
ncbi:MAG: hypothetical protein SH821_08115 [Phototrophicales bacterium]|nr:hypothetical protein [Phototrophicales bacterium]